MITVADLMALIDAERSVRRLSLNMGRPYRHHLERGFRADDPTYEPLEQHWCEHCVGFFGVPHDRMHELGVCRYAYRARNLDRQCACVDCVVAEDAAREEALT